MRWRSVPDQPTSAPLVGCRVFIGHVAPRLILRSPGADSYEPGRCGLAARVGHITPQASNLIIASSGTNEMTAFVESCVQTAAGSAAKAQRKTRGRPHARKLLAMLDG